MKKIEELYHLIQSMSQAEKRYFKLYSQKYKKGNKSNTILLFELLDKQKDFDLLILKRKLEKIGVSPSLRNYLYNQILQCLSDFFSKNETEFEIRQMLIQAQILTTKMLYDQAKKILLKAKKIAYEYNFSFLSVEISRNLFYNERLLLGSDRKAQLPFFEEVQKGLKTELVVYDTIHKYDELQNLTFEYYDGSMDTDTFWKAEEEIITYLRELPITDNLIAEINKNLCYSHYYSHIGDHESNVEVCFKNLEFLQRLKSEGRVIKHWTYINVLIHLIQPLFIVGRIEECYEYLNELEKHIIEHSEGNEHVRFYYTYAALFTDVSYAEGKFEPICKLAATFKEQYLDRQNTAILSIRYHLFTQFIYSHFLLGVDDEVILWIEEMEQLPTLIGHDYVKQQVRIIHLLVHYKLGNYQFVDNLANRYVRQTVDLKEKNFLQFIRSVYRFILKHFTYEPITKKDKQKLLNKFTEKLKEDFAELHVKDNKYKDFEELLERWVA